VFLLFFWLKLSHTTKYIAILIACIVADPIPVSVITTRIAEYCRSNAIVAAVIYGKGKIPTLANKMFLIEVVKFC